MKLIGDLKKKVEKTSTKEEAREAIANAGMLLDDDELEQVSGGSGVSTWYCCGNKYSRSTKYCRICGRDRDGNLNQDNPIAPPPPDWE